MKTVLTFFAALAVLSASAFAAKVGEHAPGFTLTDTNGHAHSLSDFEGKIVVLEWTNYGCPFVKKHYNSGNMQRLQTELTGQDVVWLSICSSKPGGQGNMSPADWNAEAKKKGVESTAILIDEDGKVGRQYGAMTTPHMFVIDVSGKLAYNGAIDSIASTSGSDVEKAENYVAQAVAALKAGDSLQTPLTKPYGCSVKYASQ